jgi:pimeloyl-ACP methyl ester carboxylesterase
LDKKKLNIYLIRGLTRESGHWGNFVNLLESQMPEAKIHLMDLPGAGIYHKTNAPSSFKKMVDFMRKDMIDRINPEEHNIIFATSLAGMLATEWTINYKNDFDGLIMVNSSFKGICSTNERANKSIRGDMLRILLTNSIKKRERLIIKVNSNKPGMVDKLLDTWILIQKKRKMSRINILRQTLAGMRYELKGGKPEIPILVIGSKGDRMVSPSCIEKIHNHFGGDLIWHPTSGHGLPLDEPEWLSKTVSNWSRESFKNYKEKIA